MRLRSLLSSHTKIQHEMLSWAQHGQGASKKEIIASIHKSKERQKERRNAHGTRLQSSTSGHNFSKSSATSHWKQGKADCVKREQMIFVPEGMSSYPLATRCHSLDLPISQCLAFPRGTFRQEVHVAVYPTYSTPSKETRWQERFANLSLYTGRTYDERRKERSIGKNRHNVWDIPTVGYTLATPRYGAYSRYMLKGNGNKDEQKKWVQFILGAFFLCRLLRQYVVHINHFFLVCPIHSQILLESEIGQAAIHVHGFNRLEVSC